MMRRKQLQVPAAAWLAIWWVLGLQGAQAAPNAEEVETMCAQGETLLVVLWPTNGHVVELELHGLELVRIEVDITICNFESLDGSLAVYGTGGETKLQDIWRPKNGRQNISIEIPFPQSSGLDDSIVMLQAGRAIEYTIELSLMDGGYEIGATASLALALVSAHVPRINPSAPGVLHEKPFIYLLSTKQEVSRADLETEASDMLQLIWGPSPPTSHTAIWAMGCTWNEARNKLLEQVRARGKHYIYYIFTDDDASLTLRPSSVPAGHQTSVLDHPWREFERLLLLWQPAAGYARYTIQQPQETKKDEPEIECVRFADPLLVAYHFEAASFLLPYTTAFDKESWWYSAVVANALQSLHFRNHIFQFNTVYVHDNQKSIGYSAFRQMNWERPMRWLVSSVGPPGQVHEIGLENPIQVKCHAAVTTLARSKPYVVAAGQFDVCHPVFAHLRLPGRGTSTRNCTGWTIEGKLFDLLLHNVHKHHLRESHLENNITELHKKLSHLSGLLQSLEERLVPPPPMPTVSVPLAPPESRQPILADEL